ncbi:MAG: hypothetical protein ACI4XB_09800 [Ruminococcus sp.]
MQVLHASEGYWLTNGVTYGRDIYLPDGADVSAWYEVTEAEKNAAIAEKEAADKAAYAAEMAKRFGGTQ